MSKTYLQIIVFSSLVCTAQLLNAMGSSSDNEEQRRTGMLTNSFGKSDNYTGSIPQPFENDKGTIRYSTPAIQGMKKNNIEPKDVEKIMNKLMPLYFEGSKDICQNHICVIFRNPTPGSKIEISSVWKE